MIDSIPFDVGELVRELLRGEWVCVGKTRKNGGRYACQPMIAYSFELLNTRTYDRMLIDGQEPIR